MASISSPQYLKPSTSVAVSQVKGQPPTYHGRHGNDPVLVATERVDHTYHLDTCILPGDAIEKMVGLKVWHTLNTGRWQAVGAYMLCKKAYIAVGTLGVSYVPSIGQRIARADMSTAIQRLGSTNSPRDAVRKPGQERNTYPRLCPTDLAGRLYGHIRPRLALVPRNTGWKRLIFTRAACTGGRAGD